MLIIFCFFIFIFNVLLFITIYYYYIVPFYYHFVGEPKHWEIPHRHRRTQRTPELGWTQDQWGHSAQHRVIMEPIHILIRPILLRLWLVGFIRCVLYAWLKLLTHTLLLLSLFCFGGGTEARSAIHTGNPDSPLSSSSSRKQHHAMSYCVS